MHFPLDFDDGSLDKQAFPEEVQAWATEKTEFKAALESGSAFFIAMVSSPHWACELPFDTAAFLAALPVLGLKGCHICVTKMYAPEAFQKLLTRWRDATGSAPEGATPGGEQFTLEIPLTSENALRLAEMVSDISSPDLSRSISVERFQGGRNRELLLDALKSDLEVDSSVPRNAIREFSRLCSVTYRWHADEPSAFPRWRIQPTPGLPAFFKALPAFPAEAMTLSILATTTHPEFPRLQALDESPSADHDGGFEFAGQRRLRIAVTPKNMDAVASAFAAQASDRLFDHCFVLRGEETILNCARTGMDVYPELSDAQMKAFCEPLGLKYRRLKAASVRGLLLKSLGQILWLLFTRPSFVWALLKHSKWKSRRR